MDKFFSTEAWEDLGENEPVMLTKGTVNFLLRSIEELQDMTTILVLTVRNMQVKAGAVDLTHELEDYLADLAKEDSDEQEEA